MRLLSFFMTVFAEGEAAGAAQQQAGFAVPMELIMIVAMIAIFYFMLIRPQRKRDKETKMMLESLKMGDKVMTHSGIYGKITQIKDDTVIIETGATGNTSTIKIARTAINRILTVKD